MRRVLTLVVLAGAVVAAGWLAAAAAETDVGGAQTLCLRGTPTCRNALQDAAEEYLKRQPKVQITVDGTCGVAGLEGLIKGTADVAFIEWPLRQSERLFWPKRYGSLKGPGPEWTFAQTTLGFIVNERNRLNRLTLDQLRGIWSGTVRQWSQVGGSGAGIAVYTIHPSRHLAGALASDFVLDYRQWGKHCQERSSHEEVIGEVLKEPAAISFLVVDRRQVVPEGVKFVFLAKDASSPAVPPTTENIVLGRYPLVREYRFVFSDRTPPGAYDFCRFVQTHLRQYLFVTLGKSSS
jgi:phosphate transport system substrate-binding protein